MTIQEKLQLLQKLSGLTQQELAHDLDVTFVAFNRWINNKAVPRVKAQAKIDELYFKHSGQKIIPVDVLTAKKDIIQQKKKKHRNVIREIINHPDICDQFFLSLTYHSNRIEGSKLSENETAAILFQNSALPNRSLTEQLEVKNHQTALQYLFDYLIDKKPLSEKLILKLHGILMNGIQADAGTYRCHGVRIIGTHVPTANYLKISTLIRVLVKEINRKNNDPIKQIALIHSQFEKIHPFSDGNGRIGRLLMHAMALKVNLSPAVIKQENKKFYISYLNKAQMDNDFSLLEDLVCEAILAGYNILERGE